MRSLFAIAAVVAALSLPASADNYKPSNDGNTNTNVNTIVATPVANATGGQGGQGGQGGKGGTGFGVGVGYGEGGNATIERGAVKVDNDNTNTNRQKQQQQQNQSQTSKSISGSYASSYAGVGESGNSNVEINDIDRRQTPPAYAPGAMIGSEVCGQTQSAGGSSPVFGFSIGITHDNDGCNLRRNATILNALGQKNAAVELLCRDDDVREAMKAAGTPCAADRAATPTAALEPMASEQSTRVATMAPVPN